MVTSMGAWGSGYSQNDDYLDYQESFAEPLIQALLQRQRQAEAGFYRDGSGGSSDLIQPIAVYDLRAQTMWTYKVLSAPDADVSLSQTQTDVLLQVSEYVRTQASTLENPEWPKTINSEMDELQAWLKRVQSWG